MKQLSVKISLLDEIQIQGIPGPKLMPLHCAMWLDDGGFAICDEFNHRVILLDDKGSCFSAIGEKGSSPGQFWYPRGMALCANNGANELIVCDSWNHRIQRFDQQGVFLGEFGGVGSKLDQFDEPVCVAPAGDGEIWALDRCNHRVKRISLKTGKTAMSHGFLSRRSDEITAIDPLLLINDPSQLSPVAGFNYPMSFARNEHGSFFVADTSNSRICIINSEGVFENVINLCGLDTIPKPYPISITITPDGLLIVGMLDGRHIIIDPNNPWRRTAIEFGTGEQSGNPLPVLTRLHGDECNLLAIDGKKGVIRKYQFVIGEAHLPKALPMNDISSWTDCDGRDWLSCLRQQGQDAPSEALIESYINNSVQAANSSLKATYETEEKLCLLQAQLTENIIIRYANSPADFTHGEYDKGLILFMTFVLEWRSLTNRRLLMRHAFIVNYARAAFLIVHCLKVEENSRLGEILHKLVSLFREDHARQSEEYDGIANWFKKFSQEKAIPSLPATSQGMRALIYLHERLNLLDKLLVLSDPENHRASLKDYSLPTWVAVAAHELDDEQSFQDWAPEALHFWALHTIQDIFSGWGDYELAIMACNDFRQKFYKVRPEELQKYRYNMAMLLQTKHDFAESNKHFEKMLVAEGDPGVAYALALNYHLYDFANPRSDELINQFLPMVNDLENEKAQWEVLKQGRTLLEKEPINAASSIQTPYKYIQSIKLTHPSSGKPIIPYLFVPTSTSTVIASDIGSKELFSYQPDTGELTLIESRLMVTGVLNAPALGTLILHEPKWPSRRPSLLRVTDNGIEEITLPANLLSSTLYRAVQLADGHIFAHDYHSKQSWLVDKNFSNCTKLLEVEMSFSDMTLTDNAIIFSSLEKNGLYRMDIANYVTTRIPITKVLFPTAIATDNNGRLYIGVPGALEIFEQDGRRVSTIKSFENEGVTYNLGYIPNITYVESFLGGNLLISDESNRMIHAIQI
ncbi:hypothetical protein MNBD_NITROSPINAE01-1439 [hydrothermal vent metagenome]|uniref:NHL repeat domain protein n=1 Tax=hydrothermal vent metagenome TaxID=652676 RepID=A0A3B1CAP5_9ZZZZ